MTAQRVWVVGKDMRDPPMQEGTCDNWEIQGVFASMDDAVSACLASGNDRYFIFPGGFEVGEMLPDETYLVECPYPVYDARSAAIAESEKEESS